MALGVFGAGRWAKNLIREFSQLKQVKAVCSRGSLENRSWLEQSYPAIPWTSNPDELFLDPEITAIVISSPSATHYELSKKALLNNKHVFCEKPLCFSIEEARELERLALERKRVLFVGYVTLYSEAFYFLEKHLKHSTLTRIDFYWEHKKNAPGSIIQELIVHDLALLQKLSLSDLKIKSKSKNEDLSQICFSGSVNGVTLNYFLDTNFSQKRKRIKFTFQDSVAEWVNDEFFLDSNSVTLPKKSALFNECSEFLKKIQIVEPQFSSENFNSEVVSKTSWLETEFVK